MQVFGSDYQPLILAMFMTMTLGGWLGLFAYCNMTKEWTEAELHAAIEANEPRGVVEPKGERYIQDQQREARREPDTGVIERRITALDLIH